MKKYKPYVVGVVCVLLVILYITCGSCKDSDPYWEGQYSILSAQLEELKVKNEKEISELTSKNSELTNEISHATRRVGDLESAVVTKDDDLLRLESQFTQLGDDSLSKDAKIGNLMEQITIWKEKFTLAEKIISEKDVIIFSLKEQYENQLRVSFNYKELYEKVQGTNVLLQTGLNRANKQIVKLRVKNKVTNLACVVLGGILIYKMVEGR